MYKKVRNKWEYLQVLVVIIVKRSVEISSENTRNSWFSGCFLLTTSLEVRESIGGI